MAACLRFTRRVWKSFVDNGGHDARCFESLNLHSAKPGVVDVSLKVEPYNLNRVGTVHGGEFNLSTVPAWLILSLTDTVGSLAVGSKGQFMTGVSVNINTTFVKPGGHAGDILRARGTVTGMGKSLAYTRVDFFNAKDQLCAYGDHVKYIGKSIDHPDNVKFSEDGETVIEGVDKHVD